MMVDLDEFEPSREHHNEFVAEKDLLEAEMWELEEELRFRLALADARMQRDADTSETVSDYSESEAKATSGKADIE